jgi:hypothetical protein
MAGKHGHRTTVLRASVFSTARASRSTQRASARHAEGNSPDGVPRVGLIDKRRQADVRFARRSDTPTQVKGENTGWTEMVRTRATACQPTSNLGFWIKCNRAPESRLGARCFNGYEDVGQAREGATRIAIIICVVKLKRCPLEPHSRGQGRLQPPNSTSASLLMTYESHCSHSLHRSQQKINGLPTFSSLYPAQACPSVPASMPGSATRARLRHALSASGVIDAILQLCQGREHVVEGGGL